MRSTSGDGMAMGPDALISFSGVDLAAANDLAGDLTEWLTEDVPDLSINRVREDERAQDFGATLVLILGSTAVTALAKGIAKWLARRQDAKLHLKRTAKNGQTRELTLEGQPSGRTEQIIADFFKD
jgi:Effector Associated Constant Component 1